MRQDAHNFVEIEHAASCGDRRGAMREYSE
jgi:hypothetical protein